VLLYTRSKTFQINLFGILTNDRTRYIERAKTPTVENA